MLSPGKMVRCIERCQFLPTSPAVIPLLVRHVGGSLAPPIPLLVHVARWMSNAPVDPLPDGDIGR